MQKLGTDIQEALPFLGSKGSTRNPAGVKGDKVQLVRASSLGRAEAMAKQNPPKPRKHRRISKRRRKELARS